MATVNFAPTPNKYADSVDFSSRPTTSPHTLYKNRYNMPAVHYYPRAFDNPFSNIFGSKPATTTDAPETSVPDPESTTRPLITDPLGGLTSALGSILSVPAPSSAESSVVASTPTTSEPPPTTTSPPPTPTTPAESETTLEITSTIPQVAQVSPSASPSTSSLPDADPPASFSVIAAAVVGTLVGIIALSMLVSFVLRRWNRSRTRKLRARESMDFNANDFRRSAAVLKDDLSAQFVEQKGYVDTPYRPSPTPTPSMGAYAQEYSYNQPQHMYAPSPSPSPYPPQQRMSIYSPNPEHGYPTAAQQVAFEYRGTSDSESMVEHPDAIPNPHPVTRPADENAYGGI
ncbi:hypothetical protein R3P38DRAFT_2825577 [Favolaschia claudopus]|uniref:Uncharacterized protein n=1 Tax=Favolaschia claudopus TaxID=2862362 RepID=A0AAW0EGU7_9AGAR